MFPLPSQTTPDRTVLANEHLNAIALKKEVKEATQSTLTLAQGNGPVDKDGGDDADPPVDLCELQW